MHFTDSFLPPSATAPPPSATALYHPSASHSSYVPTCCTSASFLAANSPTHPPAWGQRLFSLHHPGRRPCSLRPLLRPQPSPLSIRLIRCHYTKITQIRSFGKTTGRVFFCTECTVDCTYNKFERRGVCTVRNLPPSVSLGMCRRPTIKETGKRKELFDPTENYT